ncbi:MAG: putative lipid II flippase FtsW [Actinomycetota bacterium]
MAARPALRVVRSPERPRRDAAAASRRSLALLLIPTALLTVLGLVMVLSAGSISAVEGYGTSFWYFNRQALYAVAGVLAMVVAARLPHTVWQKLAAPMMITIVPLMVIALHPSSGTALYGASRWIDLGPVTLQPSEFLKLALVAFSATILTRKWRKLDDPWHLAIPLAPVVAVVALLVVLQRDLGTTVILCGTVFLMLFAAGVRLKYLGISGGVGLVAAAALIFGEEYRRTRFLDAYLHPWADRMDTGYQLVQGLIALGSGGWFGVGLGASRQKWDYLPNAHSDFIFAIVGEELGLVGAFLVMLLFGMLLYAGIRIALQAPDTFGRLLAAGITSWIGLQTFINMGAVTGLLPITGVPLPLLSFGGTALVVTLTGIGVLVSIARAGAGSGKGSRVRASGRGRSGSTARKART